MRQLGLARTLRTRRQATAAGSSPRGMSLIELLVVLPLFLLVGSMVAELLMTGSRLFNKLEDQLDTQAAALLAVNTLTRELRATTYTSLTVTCSAQGAVACAFRRRAVALVREDGTSSPFVIFWHDAPQRAIGRIEVARDASYQRLDAGTIASLVAQQTSSRHIAHFVRDLSFTLRSADLLGPSLATFPNAAVTNPVLTITLLVSTSASPSSGQRLESYVTSVGMRNSL